MLAPWVPCDCCGDYLCNIHMSHAHECECPVVDDWEYSPYEVQPMNDNEKKRYKDGTIKQRQVNFKARQRNSGLVQSTVWIPKDKKPDLAAFVARLIEENK